jgi:hypothetical protein
MEAQREVAAAAVCGVLSVIALAIVGGPDQVVSMLSKDVSSEAAEGFPQASDETGHAALSAQIGYLESLVQSEELPTELRVSGA